MKHQIGDKVLLLPHRGMSYGYNASMDSISNTITTITNIKEVGYTEYKLQITVEDNYYHWGVDSIVLIPNDIIYVPHGSDSYIIVERGNREIVHTYNISSMNIDTLLNMHYYSYREIHEALRLASIKESIRQDLIDFLKSYSMDTVNAVKYEGKYLYISKHSYSILYDMMPNAIDRSRKKINTDGIVVIEVTNNLSSSNINYLYNSKKGEFFTKGTNQKIKVGKIVSQIDPSLDSTQIEKVVSTWKKRYTVDTSRVCIMSDIADVYDISPVGGSCMANKGEFMQIYSDVGCKIAYILKNDGDLAARCIYWDNNIEDSEGVVCSAYDRIFFKVENDKLTLERYFYDLGIPSITKKYYTTIESTDGEYYEGVPYIDNMYYVNKEYKLTNTNIEGTIDTLQNTDGTSSRIGKYISEDSVYCEDTENYVHINDAYLNNTRECYYECYDDLVHVEDRGYYESDDSAVVFCEDIGEYRMADDAWNCESSENWYYDEDFRVDTYCGSTFHIDNIPSEYAFVEDTGEWMDSMMEELVRYKKDGLVYTLDYYKDELEPDHMEVL